MIHVKFRNRTFKFPMEFETAENLRGDYWLDKPWEDLVSRDRAEVSVRVWNCLYIYSNGWGIHNPPRLVTVRDLTALTFQGLTKIKNMGAQSASEVTAALFAVGLCPAPCKLDDAVSVRCAELISDGW